MILHFKLNLFSLNHVGLWRGHDTFVVSLKLMWRSFNWHLYKNQGEYQNSITTTISALVFSHNICAFKCKLSLEGNNFQLYPCLLSNLIADTDIKNMRKNLCNSQLVQNSTLKKLSIKYPKVLLHEERPCLRPYTPALFLKEPVSPMKDLTQFPVSYRWLPTEMPWPLVRWPEPALL